MEQTLTPAALPAAFPDVAPRMPDIPAVAGDAANPAASAPPDTPSGDAGGPEATRTAAEYAFDLPDHLVVDTAAAERFRALCAAQGLTPEQARAAVDFYVAEHEAAGGLAADQCEAGLRTLWKGRYDERIGAARRAVRALDVRMQGRLAPLVRAGLGNHPAFAELMALVAERTGEDALGAGSGPAGARGEAMSTEEFLRTVVFAKR